MIRQGLVLLGAVSLSLPTLGQAPSLRPGRYEVTSELSLPGRPTMPPRKDVNCLSAKDLADLSTALVKEKASETCKVTRQQATASGWTFTRVCTAGHGGTEVTYSGEVSITSAESYHAVIHMKGSAGAATNPLFQGSTVTITATRVGECSR
jgi:Protein of unknown function (DUF3617)